jgi:hypothetical protein
VKGEGLALILGSPKKGEPKEPMGEEPEGEEDPLDVAAEEVLGAMKGDDPKALKDALKSFFELC